MTLAELRALAPDLQAAGDRLPRAQVQALLDLTPLPLTPAEWLADREYQALVLELAGWTAADYEAACDEAVGIMLCECSGCGRELRVDLHDRAPRCACGWAVRR